MLASELLPAIYDPQKYDVDLSRSEVPNIRLAFEMACTEARSFIDLLRDGADVQLGLLRFAFETFQECEDQGMGYRSLSLAEVLSARRSLQWLFGIFLNFAYRAYWRHERPDCYLRFVEWAKRAPGWPVVVTTNWDFVLDTLISASYGLDIIDCGDCEPSLDVFLTRYVAHGSPTGKAISLYKLNGSLDWLYCPSEKGYFSPLFQPPWNMGALTITQTLRLKFHNPDEPIPNELRPGYCVNCGTPLEVRLHTPGASRARLPMEPRIKQNVLAAVRNCCELVFAGFSCPDEDRDVVEEIGASLRINPLFKSGDLIPTVIDIAGPHGQDTKNRFERALATRIEYRDIGFKAWVDSLT